MSPHASQGSPFLTWPIPIWPIQVSSHLWMPVPCISVSARRPPCQESAAKADKASTQVGRAHPSVTSRETSQQSCPPSSIEVTPSYKNLCNPASDGGGLSSATLAGPPFLGTRRERDRENDSVIIPLLDYIHTLPLRTCSHGQGEVTKLEGTYLATYRFLIASHLPAVQGRSQLPHPGCHCPLNGILRATPRSTCDSQSWAIGHTRTRGAPTTLCRVLAQIIHLPFQPLNTNHIRIGIQRQKKVSRHCHHRHKKFILWQRVALAPSIPQPT